MVNSYYTKQNGQAQRWDRDNARLLLAKWAFHHPEALMALMEKLSQYGIDLINHEMAENPTYYRDVFVRQLEELTAADIEEIFTGIANGAESVNFIGIGGESNGK